MIKTTHRVRRWTRNDFSGTQKLERVTWVLGIPVWVAAVDQEEVPIWATIQRAALGYTEWESRIFKQYSELLK